jgi:hypothetical protein
MIGDDRIYLILEIAAVTNSKLVCLPCRQDLRQPHFPNMARLKTCSNPG